MERRLTARHGDDFETLLRKQPAQPGAHHPVVIHHQHPQGVSSAVLCHHVELTSERLAVPVLTVGSVAPSHKPEAIGHASSSAATPPRQGETSAWETGVIAAAAYAAS